MLNLTEQTGESLVLAAATAAIAIAQGRSADEIETLAAFLDVVADSLALIAGQLPTDGPVTEL